jgi:hypothetical protein
MTMGNRIEDPTGKTALRAIPGGWSQSLLQAAGEQYRKPRKQRGAPRGMRATR